MAYNEQLANRIRERLVDLDNITEKAMMGGLVFMYNDKMCVGIMKNDLMCRIDPTEQENALEQQGCELMQLGGKQMNGYVVIDETGIRTAQQFDHWINLALQFNPKAKVSKKKSK